jgi:hypothetical protein
VKSRHPQGHIRTSAQPVASKRGRRLNVADAFANGIGAYAASGNLIYLLSFAAVFGKIELMLETLMAVSANAGRDGGNDDASAQ